ncbi:unnamed protein product [Microthlaspi erraticum]|uniref:SWIM-type domain-containing protein n=1 Tax=Microthlaspi erraticum TaxID=1685480 RepID=A0A6D2IRB0_9BRAS|nr:unnamed protein product [Microthlaspi erraticum]
MVYKNNAFKYDGVLSKPGLLMDPDYATWSLFQDFADEHAANCVPVQQIWYKLSSQDMDKITSIFHLRSDAEINQMCGIVIEGGGELDLFLEQLKMPAISHKEDEREAQAVNEATEEENRDDIVDYARANKAVEEEQEEDIVKEGGDDARFLEYYQEIRLNDNVGQGFDTNGEDVAPTGEETAGEPLDDDDEAEMERQCHDADRPEPVVDTDDEWDDFCRKETAVSRTTYRKEKAPYLWLMQTLRSGNAFKDQLLRYVLKTNYDVKLCRWEKTKLAAVCTNEKCPWKIYCSVEKPKKLWMVKSFVDVHNHMKSSKARMLKQGVIANLYKDEARRRPGLRWTDIKDEIMLRNTWKSCCRPIIGLDGAFLKWELKGEILAAVGRDADNRIFPIAWAIVRVEDTESWTWFVEKLKIDLGLELGNGITIISDKQKGLINVVADLLPNAEHRHCARHIFANWRKNYKTEDYEDYFWDIAYNSNVGDFQFNMDALKAFDETAYTDLLKTEPKIWCRAWFPYHSRSEDVTNNLSESYNRTIKEARKLPLINMLEEIRRLAMKRISRRREKTRSCVTKFPPHIMAIFEKNRKASKHCTVIQSSESLYEVMELTGSFEVCLPEKHCGCNQWNLTGIPCRHAICVITEHNYDPEE